MLTLLLALTATSFPVRGYVACPTVADIEARLDTLRTAELPHPGWVEVARVEGALYVVLTSAEGLPLAAKRYLGSDCDGLANEAARGIMAWEKNPLPAPWSVREYEAARRPNGNEPIDAEVYEEVELGRGARMFGAFVGALVGALPAFLLAMTSGPTGRPGMLVAMQVLLGPPAIGTLAFAGHRIAGGHTAFGWAMLGGVLGSATALIALGAPVEFKGDWVTPTDPSRLVLASVLVAASPIVMLELGEAMERSTMQAAVAPLPGGGAGIVIGSRW